MTHRTASVGQCPLNSSSLTHKCGWDQYPSVRSKKKNEGAPGIVCTTFPPRSGTSSVRRKVAEELKKIAQMPIQSYVGVTSLKRKAPVRSASQNRNRIKDAMPKTLESVPTTSRVSPNPVQFRSLSGTKVMVLALLFAIAALSAVFLLLQ
jgi:hypothetical protein